MIIAFSGCSGSGKTTFIGQIKDWDYFKGKKVVIKDEDSFLSIRLLKRVLGEKPFSEYKKDKMYEHDRGKQSTGLFTYVADFFYPVVVYLEYLLDYFIYELINKDVILLKDRYIYDYLVTFEHNIRTAGRFTRFFYLRFPRPYLMFYIKISPDTALDRNKNEVEGKITIKPEFHEAVIRSYNNIAVYRNLLVIENDENLEISVHTVKNHILNKAKLSRTGRIVITGLDGSGKTTLAKEFTNYLTMLNIPWKIAHFYHDNILYKFLKYIGYYDTDEPEEVIFERSRAHNVRVKAKGKSFIWGVLHFTDSLVQFVFFNIFYGRRLIIYDRYFYDFLVSFAFLRVPHIDLFEKIIPPVKNKFLLVCSPEIMYNRKPETTLEFAAENYHIYLEVAKRFNLIKIDSGEKSTPLILSEIIERIV